MGLVAYAVALLFLIPQVNLQFWQVTHGVDNIGRFVRFVGTTSKTTQGGIKQRAQQQSSKAQKHYVPKSHDYSKRMDFADLVSTYRSALLSAANNHTFPTTGEQVEPERFYLKPLASSSSWKGGICFKKQAVWKNTLRNYIPNMCREAGIAGHFTSHSAEASCATQLFDARLDEQLIQERTGHRSESSVRRYKMTTAALTEHVSIVLDGVPAAGPSLKRPKQRQSGKLKLKAIRQIVWK